MDLKAYLERIGFDGDLRPDLDCLTGIHRCHALSVPYENLDVQLGRPVDQDIDRIYDKIVVRRRGGWCYEQNGLLFWALRELGFDVMRATGAVWRHVKGDNAVGNHLVLFVNLDRIYLADLGVGDAMREPVPMASGTYEQGSLEFRLEDLNDGFWRVHNHEFASADAFDVREGPADEPLLARKNLELQTSPESEFVQNLICIRMYIDSVSVLAGKVLAHRTKDGEIKNLLTSADDLEQTLADVFGINDPDIRSLWPKIEARHYTVFGDTPIQNIDTSEI